MCAGEAAEAGINVCAHASSKAAAQKTKQKLKRKNQRELRHFGKKEKNQKQQQRPCEAAFARRSQHQIYGSVFIIYVRTGFHHTWRELAQLQTLPS